MTKKDYIAIAQAISSQKPAQGSSGAQFEQWGDVANAIAGKLADDNPRFDRDRFLKACGA